MRVRVAVRVVVAAVASALLWSGFVAPAQAASASEVVSAMLDVADTATIYAEQVGGYRAERTSQYGDGGKLTSVSKYEANGSFEFHEVYKAPANSGLPTTTVDFIWDAEAKAFAFPRPDNDEARRAYKIIGAPDSAWLVRTLPSFNGTTMKSRDGGAGANILAFLHENEVVSGSFDSSSVRAEVEGYGDTRGTIILTLGAVGELTEVRFTDDSGFSLTEKIVYDNYSSERPAPSESVSYVDFERALQSEYLSDRVYGLAVETRINLTRATPASLQKEAKRQVAEAYRNGWYIKVKVRKIKFGVRLQAKHPFAKQTFAYDVVARPPFPSSSMEIIPRSSTP